MPARRATQGGPAKQGLLAWLWAHARRFGNGYHTPVEVVGL